MNTVKKTINNGLCISCGICKAVCPKNCISYGRIKGLYVPKIKDKECVDCGRCYQVCPGKGFDYSKYDSLETKDFWMGEYKSIYIASTKNKSRLQNAVSGGVVTELVYNLLEEGDYQVAFLISNHQYKDGIVEADSIYKGDDLKTTQKSRYLPVSQEKTVNYMLSHRDDKMILVGTSCFVQGILKVIETYKLSRQNYFIIGLFCDKTMNLNVVDYFSKHSALDSEELDSLYFRSKEVGGWPGGVRLETKAGKQIDLPNTERMKIKDYFCPERCLYCLDKLNKYADISVGDNYTGEILDELGGSSVIVRTVKGQSIWEEYASKFEVSDSSAQKIQKSQHLNNRKNNLKYSILKENKCDIKINTINDQVSVGNITWKTKFSYRLKLWKQKIGIQYEKNPGILNCFLLFVNLKIYIRKLIKRS